MRCTSRLLISALLAVACVACDSIELTIAVNQPEKDWLEIVNATNTVWRDAHLLVEANESEGASRPCGEQRVARWEPGEAIRVQVCGEKHRFTVTTGGETARFSYSKGQLYRRIGRKEVPIVK